MNDKTHIKLMGRWWLREPGEDAQNTKEELQFLAGLLKPYPADWPLESWSGPMFHMGDALSPNWYTRPRMDLPEIPEGYMLFGEGPVPGELLPGAHHNYKPGRWRESLDGNADCTYIVKTDLWEAYLNPVQSDWERFCTLAANPNDSRVVEHESLSGWKDSTSNQSCWVKEKRRRVIKKFTRDRTPDEWRAMAIQGGYMVEMDSGAIAAMSLNAAGNPQYGSGWKKLWHKGQEIPVQIEDVEIIAEYDPSKVEGERITEGGAE